MEELDFGLGYDSSNPTEIGRIFYGISVDIQNGKDPIDIAERVARHISREGIGDVADVMPLLVDDLAARAAIIRSLRTWVGNGTYCSRCGRTYHIDHWKKRKSEPKPDGKTCPVCWGPTTVDRTKFPWLNSGWARHDGRCPRIWGGPNHHCVCGEHPPGPKQQSTTGETL